MISRVGARGTSLFAGPVCYFFWKYYLRNTLKPKINLNLRFVEENKSGRDEIYSEKVKAGKRTYFFDVKSTRSNDYYLTITESKKRYNKDDEGFTYEKHKIFLYKEDFNKFMDALNNTVNHVKNELMPGVDFTQFDHAREERDASANSEMEIAEVKPAAVDSELKWD